MTNIPLEKKPHKTTEVMIKKITSMALKLT